jgi:hypothetical protein
MSNCTFWLANAVSARTVFLAGVLKVGDTIELKLDGVTRTTRDEVPSGRALSRSLNFINSGTAYWIGRAIIIYCDKLFLN